MEKQLRPSSEAFEKPKEWIGQVKSVKLDGIESLTGEEVEREVSLQNMLRKLKEG